MLARAASAVKPEGAMTLSSLNYPQTDSKNSSFDPLLPVFISLATAEQFQAHFASEQERAIAANLNKKNQWLITLLYRVNRHNDSNENVSNLRRWDSTETDF